MISTPKIKILHVIPSFNMGGMENGLVNLINRSNKDIFTHEICCVVRSGNAEKRLNKKVEIFEMQKRPGNDWRMIPKIAKRIRLSRPDIVHTRNWGAAVDGILAAKMTRVPVRIHGEHGWNMDDPSGQNLKRRIARKILSYWADCFVAVSEDIKKWMINSVRIKEAQIKVIINGVDTDKFCPGNKEHIKKEFGFSNSDYIIGTVGRLDPVKDQQLLLQAFDKVPSEEKNLCLVIVGEGPERKRLEAVRDRLSSRKRIFFFGEREDVDKILKMLDIFVLPSKSEGISNTLLEAMSAGLPVIATDVGGNPEIVQDGNTGLLIPPNNCNVLVNALVFYIEQNPHLMMHHGRNARERTIREFSLERMVKEYETLYTVFL